MTSAMIKKIAIIGALIIGLLAAWIYEENRRADAVRLPEGGTDLITFLEARPEPSRIRKFVHNEKVHIEVLGKPVMSPLSVPSGPPAYVFDETGALVDWTGDRGDDSAFMRKWGSLSNATFISVDEAKRVVKAPNLDPTSPHGFPHDR